MTHELITDDDLDSLDTLDVDKMTLSASDLYVLASRLRARYAAEALEDAAANPTATLWDEVIKRGVPAVSASDLRVLAAEYRSGVR